MGAISPFPAVFSKTFPNKPWFLHVCSTSLLKTQPEKEKLPLQPVPKVFSTSLDEFSAISSNLKLASANSISLEKSKFCCLGKA